MKLFIKLMLISGIALTPMVKAKWNHETPLSEYTATEAIALMHTINSKLLDAGKAPLFIFSTSVLNGVCGKSLVVACSNCEVVASDTNTTDHTRCLKPVEASELPVIVAISETDKKDLYTQTVTATPSSTAMAAAIIALGTDDQRNKLDAVEATLNTNPYVVIDTNK